MSVPDPAFVRPYLFSSSPITPENAICLPETVAPVLTVRVRVPPLRVTGPSNSIDCSLDLVGNVVSAAIVKALLMVMSSVVGARSAAPLRISSPIPNGPFVRLDVLAEPDELSIKTTVPLPLRVVFPL